MKNFPIQLLKEWFLCNKRSLPWRENPTPYRVWISEVMLQQTQVAVVIPYFEKWMHTFPTIEVLAHASQDLVLKCWEGLGYYSRARNLHAAAKYVVEHFQGQLPSKSEWLAQIKGIGPYTQGAIRGFAFKEKAAAVDGNVLRLLSRFLAFEEVIDLPQSRKKLCAYVEKILPDDEPWLISEGLIELGATICTKKAKCPQCPLKKECLGYRHHLQDRLPNRRPRPERILLRRLVGVIVCNGKYLLRKGEQGKVMADLFEFPYVTWDEQRQGDVAALFGTMFCLNLKYIKPLSPQHHTFTHHRALLFPHLMEASCLTEKDVWKEGSELKELPFSSGHRKILNTREISVE